MVLQIRCRSQGDRQVLPNLSSVFVLNRPRLKQQIIFSHDRSRARHKINIFLGERGKAK